MGLGIIQQRHFSQGEMPSMHFEAIIRRSKGANQ